jgi:excisionase family DNA binding protein
MLTRPLGPDRTIDLLTSKQVARRLSISVRTLWRLLKQGTVPEPLRYSRKLVRWRATDIDGFVAARPPGVPAVADAAHGGQL